MSLCHTVTVESNDQEANGTEHTASTTEYEYQASSPDEKALIEACRRYGEGVGGIGFWTWVRGHGILGMGLWAWDCGPSVNVSRGLLSLPLRSLRC